MVEEAFNSTVLFLSRHFELIMAINIAIFAYYVFIIIALKMAERSFRHFLANIFKSALYSSFFVVQVLLFIVMVYLYWFNYHKPADYLLIPADIVEHTLWVKSDQTIYFIDGTNILSTQPSGANKQYIYEGKSPVREYHISPNGRYMLIVSAQELHLLDLQSEKVILIDQITLEEEDQKLKGVLSGIRWAKDSGKFCYEISRWSSYTSQDFVYIYFIDEAWKASVKSPTRRISHLYWDTEGKHLYYLKHETEGKANINQVKVIRIPLESLTPELVLEIPYESAAIPFDHLRMRGINLFIKGDLLSFTDFSDKQNLVSQMGERVGIDEDDNFYFISHKWFKQRFFKVRRKPKIQEGPLKRYQYKGGELAISNIRWLPQSRYVMMEHHDLGILILDTYKNKVGQMIAHRGRNFGWYIDIDAYTIQEEHSNEALNERIKDKKRFLSFIPR